MPPLEAERRVAARPGETRSAIGLGLAGLALWMIRVTAALILAVPLLLIALWWTD